MKSRYYAYASSLIAFFLAAGLIGLFAFINNDIRRESKLFDQEAQTAADFLNRSLIITEGKTPPEELIRWASETETLSTISLVRPENQTAWTIRSPRSGWIRRTKTIPLVQGSASDWDLVITGQLASNTAVRRYGRRLMAFLSVLFLTTLFLYVQTRINPGQKRESSEDSPGDGKDEPILRETTQEEEPFLKSQDPPPEPERTDSHPRPEAAPEAPDETPRTTESSAPEIPAPQEASKRITLKECLDNEVARASSFDQDMVLLMVRPIFQNDPDEELFYKNLLKRHPFSSLIHKTPEGDFGIIFPQVSLDQAMKKAEQLRDWLMEQQESLAGCFLGISSRNGRLIDGPRLYKEAAGALARAQKDPEHPVIGFKIDPARYRDYITKCQ